MLPARINVSGFARTRKRATRRHGKEAHTDQAGSGHDRRCCVQRYSGGCHRSPGIGPSRCCSFRQLYHDTYWAVGRRIVEEEQHGRKRADYGEQLVMRLAKDLTSRYGRGFGYRNVYQMRHFYMAYPRILQTPSAKFRAAPPSGKPASTEVGLKKELAKGFPLSWSHYVRLLSVREA